MATPMLVPFLAEHVVAIQGRDGGAREPWAVSLDKERRGPAYTLLLEGRVVVCAGVMLLWPGVGTVWANVSGEFPRVKVWATRTIRRMLADVIRAYGLHRLESVALADNERNQRYMEFLGFEREDGKARAYTPDKRDVVRYQLVRP